MPEKEAEARIKINKLLEKAGWRLCDDENGRKNVTLLGKTNRINIISLEIKI